MNAGRDLIRIPEALRRFQISERTLTRWRKAGLVGETRLEGVIWVDAADIEDLRRAAFVPRTVVPISPEVVVANATVSDRTAWETDPFWTGTEARP